MLVLNKGWAVNATMLGINATDYDDVISFISTPPFRVSKAVIKSQG